MKRAERQGARDRGAGLPAKKPYAKPRLARHGDVEEITRKLRTPGPQTDIGSEIICDRIAKENFSAVDGRDILARLAAIPIESWNYKGDSPAVRHMGPMAQDFSAAFGLGEDATRINTVDASGVALASIQALYQMVLDKEAKLQALQGELDELRKEVAHLRDEPVWP